jgi:hypothetical protein
VLYLSPANGSPLATAFQPLLEPGSKLHFTPPGVVDAAVRQFVISDGRDKIYLVALNNQPQPQLAAVAEAAVGPDPIVSPVFVLGDLAVAVTRHSRLVRFRLPSLEPAGETALSAPLAWGPYPVAAGLLFATAEGQLQLVTAEGRAVWTAPLEHGEPIGAPLVIDGSFFISYRRGVFERRSLADGQASAFRDVAHSLAAGPIQFLDRFLLTAHDGTLLVVDQP